MAWGILLIPLLACGVDGDLASMGCPPGERCGQPNSLSFTREGAFRCGGLRTIDALAGFDPGAPEVALGGRTRASVWPGFYSGVPVSESRFSDHFETLPTGDARATRLGPGRFNAYDDTGTLINYLSIPVVVPATAMVLDSVACTDQQRVWLRGSSYLPLPVVLDAAGNPLVDLDATVSRVEGSADDRVRWRIAFGGGEAIEELAVVDAIERIEPVLTPLQQLLDGDALAAGGSGPVCFQAFVDDAVALGVPVDAAVGDAPEALAITELGPCVLLDDQRVAPAPARTAHLTVSMANATRTFDVHLRALE